jgi:hypothetical protein
VLDFAARSPATGLMAFHWSGISKEWDKVESLKRAFLAFRQG